MAQYEEEDNLEYLEDIEQQLREQNSINRKLHSAQVSLFGDNNDDNLIKYQLSLKEDLERIYHLLRGDMIVRDDKGNVDYKEQEDDDLKPFNEFGVQILMQIMQTYLCKNTILSNYDEETINWKVYDFGIELSDLIFNRYEDMMMTTTFDKEFMKLFGVKPKMTISNKVYVEVNGARLYVPDEVVDSIYLRLEHHELGKIKMYPMIVRELVDAVHSAYLRALKGGERESLRTARTVTQSDMLGRRDVYPMSSTSQKKGSKLNPLNWLKP